MRKKIIFCSYIEYVLCDEEGKVLDKKNEARMLFVDGNILLWNDELLMETWWLLKLIF